MPQTRFQRELDLATQVAREAGALIRARGGRRNAVRHKALHDLVTETDLEAQRLITDALRSAFPEHGIVAEEGAADAHLAPSGHPRWIVDPLDGTTNFAHDIAPYCVSIGLQDGAGELAVGVIYEVTRDELFAARRGGGATRNGEPIRVSATAELSNALVTTGFPFREHWYLDAYMPVLRRFMLETRGVRRPGSAAADLAYVACGRFEAFFETGLSAWDLAAGLLLVREAGGEVSGLVRHAEPLRTGQVLATNRRLHERALEITRPLGEFTLRNARPT